VSGYYKFNPPGVSLDEEAYERLRRIDSGMPEWAEFLSLLDSSEFRQYVYTRTGPTSLGISSQVLP
jgi:hypothetical protein